MHVDWLCGYVSYLSSALPLTMPSVDPRGGTSPISHFTHCAPHPSRICPLSWLCPPSHRSPSLSGTHPAHHAIPPSRSQAAAQVSVSAAERHPSPCSRVWRPCSRNADATSYTMCHTHPPSFPFVLDDKAFEIIATARSSSNPQPFATLGMPFVQRGRGATSDIRYAQAIFIHYCDQYEISQLQYRNSGPGNGRMKDAAG